MRVTDEVWRDFLRHLRYSRVQKHVIEMLRTLLIIRHDTQADFSMEPWNDLSLVTPCHAVGRLWNEAALKKHAQSQKFEYGRCHCSSEVHGNLSYMSVKISGERRVKTLRRESSRTSATLLSSTSPPSKRTSTAHSLIHPGTTRVPRPVPICCATGGTTQS